MKLTFLGQPYEATPIELAPVESNLTGKYRGNPVQISTGRVALRASTQLTYRGVAYNS